MWFEIYHEGEPWDGTKGYRWRLKNRNGRIGADSGEAYSSKSGARRSINNIVGAFQDGMAGVDIRYAD